MDIAKKIVEEVAGRTAAAVMFVVWWTAAQLSENGPPFWSKLKSKGGS